MYKRQRLRRYTKDNGFIFTGGVAGVGVDVFKGVLEENHGQNTRFFVLLPKGVSPDHDYDKLSFPNEVEVVPFGRDMFERRIGMGKVADVVIVLNGRYGTLHEALCGLENGKKLIVLNHGGAGSLLYYAKAKNVLPASLVKAGFRQEHLNNIILADIEHIEDALEEAQGRKPKEKSPLILSEPMAGALFSLGGNGEVALNPQAALSINALNNAYNGLTLEIDVDALIDTSRGLPQLKGLGFREVVTSLYQAQEKKEIPENLRIRLINLNPNLDKKKIIKVLGLTDDLLRELVVIPDIPADYITNGLGSYLVDGSIRIVFEDNLRYWGNKIDVLVKKGKETETLSSLGLIVAALAKEPKFYESLPQDVKEYIVAVTDAKGNIALDDKNKIKQLIFKPIEKTKVDTQYLEHLDKANKELEGMV